MKKYLTDVRGVPWNRVMWKSAGRYRGKGLEIFHLGFGREGLAKVSFPYELPAPAHIISDCAISKKGKSLRKR